MYRLVKPLTTPLMLLNPTIKKVQGRIVKEYPDTGDIVYTSFRTFGGTEAMIGDVIAFRDTADIETWYRPDITADSRFKAESGKIYEVIGEPENIENRNQTLKIKVESIRGSSIGKE